MCVCRIDVTFRWNDNGNRLIVRGEGKTTKMNNLKTKKEANDQRLRHLKYIVCVTAMLPLRLMNVRWSERQLKRLDGSQ